MVFEPGRVIFVFYAYDFYVKASNIFPFQFRPNCLLFCSYSDSGLICDAKLGKKFCVAFPKLIP